MCSFVISMAIINSPVWSKCLPIIHTIRSLGLIGHRLLCTRIQQDALFSDCGELSMRVKFTRHRCSRHSREGGQAALFLMLAMGLFLLGGIGFAVDMANM